MNFLKWCNGWKIFQFSSDNFIQNYLQFQKCLVFLYISKVIKMSMEGLNIGFNLIQFYCLPVSIIITYSGHTFEPHIAKIKINQNRKIDPKIFYIWCKSVAQKIIHFKKRFYVWRCVNLFRKHPFWIGFYQLNFCEISISLLPLSQNLKLYL